jgi:hypothetical protein
MYTRCLYWAFQTLTTVGYGDFGCKTNWEMIITIFWMGFGVIFYSLTVGTLTSVITEEVMNEESLTLKLRAIETFSVETKLDETLKEQLKTFLSNNYNELFQRVDEDAMLASLP